jgi:hypothetical protein
MSTLLQWEPVDWRVDAEVENMFARYLSQYVLDTRCDPASTATKIETPSVSCHVSDWTPYLDQYNGTAEGMIRVTLRSNASANADDLMQKSRDLHAQLKGYVLGALIVVDEATKQNVLHTLVNEQEGGALLHYALVSRVQNGVDDEHRHYVTEIDLRCLWTPRRG